jgi:hypothetical protein
MKIKDDQTPPQTTRHFELRSSFFFLMMLMGISCSSGFELKEGDFLFQDLDCGPMCTAIEEVTQGIDGARLSHVGLVVSNNDTLKVAEAITAGVVLTPLHKFINRSHDSDGNPKILVGRLTPKYQHLTPAAIQNLNNYYNSPYNDSFLMGNNRYYCSQLLYIIYKAANKGQEVFTLNPMTFKQTGKESFYPVWIDHFNKLGIAIPEGEPGINPGGMSTSPYIEIVHAMGKPDGWKIQE